MAYGGPSEVRDNFGRMQKQATINITKKLRKLATEVREDVSQDVADKLLETYKDNVKKSYTPRGDGSYIHTDTFLDDDNIKTVIENEPGIGRDRVKIVLNSEVQYPNGRSLKEVYEYLTEGTKGGGDYRYFDEENKTWHWAHNHPTPKHEFELHTQEQMKGYLETLTRILEIVNRKQKRR